VLVVYDTTHLSLILFTAQPLHFFFHHTYAQPKT